MKTHLTDHARKRIVKRGLPPELVTFIVQHGKSVRSRGGKIYAVRTKHVAKLAAALTVPLREKLARFPYVVTSNDGAVITTGWRRKRVKHIKHSHPRTRRRS